MYIKIYIDIYTSRERERKHDARLLSWSDYCFPQVSFFFCTDNNISIVK